MNNTKREEYERVFNCLDKNRDGKLSAREIHECLEAIESGRPRREEEYAVDQVGRNGEKEEWILGHSIAMEETDEEREGSLGFEEFVRMVEEGEEKEKERDLKKAFEIMEGEGDEEGHESSSGGITPRSLKRMLSRLGQPHTLHDCELMISHFDLNGDGLINFDEFRAMML